MVPVRPGHPRPSLDKITPGHDAPELQGAIARQILYYGAYLQCQSAVDGDELSDAFRIAEKGLGNSFGQNDVIGFVEGMVGAACEQGQADDLEKIVIGGQCNRGDLFVAHLQHIGVAAIIVGSERQCHPVDLRDVVLQRAGQRNGYLRGGLDVAIVREIVLHLVGLRVAGRKPVEAALVMYPEADQQGHGHANSQAKNIQTAVYFVADDAAPGGLQVCY